MVQLIVHAPDGGIDDPQNLRVGDVVAILNDGVLFSRVNQSAWDANPRKRGEVNPAYLGTPQENTPSIFVIHITKNNGSELTKAEIAQRAAELLETRRETVDDVDRLGNVVQKIKRTGLRNLRINPQSVPAGARAILLADGRITVTVSQVENYIENR